LGVKRESPNTGHARDPNDPLGPAHAKRWSDRQIGIQLHERQPPVAFQRILVPQFFLFPRIVFPLLLHAFSPLPYWVNAFSISI
jgi:hypothetical protein